MPFLGESYRYFSPDGVPKRLPTETGHEKVVDPALRTFLEEFDRDVVSTREFPMDMNDTRDALGSYLKLNPHNTRKLVEQAASYFMTLYTPKDVKPKRRFALQGHFQALAALGYGLKEYLEGEQMEFAEKVPWADVFYDIKDRLGKDPVAVYIEDHKKKDTYKGIPRDYVSDAKEREKFAALVEERDHAAVADDELRKALERFEEEVIQRMPRQYWPLRVRHFDVARFSRELGTPITRAAENLWRDVKGSEVVLPVALEDTQGREALYVTPDTLRLLRVVSHVVGQHTYYDNVDWKDTKEIIRGRLGEHRLAKMMGEKEQSSEDQKEESPRKYAQDIVEDLLRALRTKEKGALLGSDLGKIVVSIPRFGEKQYKDAYATARELARNIRLIPEGEMVSRRLLFGEDFTVNTLTMMRFIVAARQGELDRFSHNITTFYFQEMQHIKQTCVALLEEMESERKDDDPIPTLADLFDREVIKIYDQVKEKIVGRTA